MLRSATKPRNLGLFALLVLVVASFWRLGLWQLNVAQHHDEQPAVVAGPTRPLEQVLRPHETWTNATLGALATATGRYAAADQVLVSGRRLDGVVGYWVVAPLTHTADDGTIAVVRGFVTDPAQAPPAPAGTWTVTGALAAGESPASTTGVPGQLGSVDLSILVNQWPGDLYNAFVFATDERSDTGAPADLGSLRRVPPPTYAAAQTIQWRNAAYAFQWWAFALFAVFLWGRIVRDDARGDRSAEDSPIGAPVGENGVRES